MTGPLGRGEEVEHGADVRRRTASRGAAGRPARACPPGARGRARPPGSARSAGPGPALDGGPDRGLEGGGGGRRRRRSRPPTWRGRRSCRRGRPPGTPRGRGGRGPRRPRARTSAWSRRWPCGCRWRGWPRRRRGSPGRRRAGRSAGRRPRRRTRRRPRGGSATMRMPAAVRASRTGRKLSPGTVKAMRTPAARSVAATSSATVAGSAGADVARVVRGLRARVDAARAAAAPAAARRLGAPRCGHRLRRRARRLDAGAGSTRASGSARRPAPVGRRPPALPPAPASTPRAPARGVGLAARRGLGARLPTPRDSPACGTGKSTGSGSIGRPPVSGPDGGPSGAGACGWEVCAGVEECGAEPGRDGARCGHHADSRPATTTRATMIMSMRAARAPGIVDLLAVVLELERDGLVELAQPHDDPLQLVLALAGHADGVALDLRLDLRELVADQLDQLARQVVGQAAPQRDLLADLVAAGRDRPRPSRRS